MAFPKSHAKTLHRLGRILVKSHFYVLSCLDTRKNQRKSRLKSLTRWVPRGRNCHAAQLAPPAAWLKQCRLDIPALRSAPDPFAGHAFMPFYLYQQCSTFPAFTSIAENIFPPLGLKTSIKDKKIVCLTAVVRLLTELVRWFKPRRGVISSKGRSPLYGANNFYKP